MSALFQLVPISRLMLRKVRSGLVIAWRLATSTTSTSPPLLNATTLGVVRAPSELGMTTGSPASRNETTLLVVPRSIPTALAMMVCTPGGWVGGGGNEMLSELHATLPLDTQPTNPHSQKS